MADGPALNAQIVRGLQDRLYDKRKAAALDVEKLIKDHAGSKDVERVRGILDTLVQEFAYSVNANARNGGLIALAAASIALGQDVAAYLDDIVPPVLACFADQDSRVRYYACESMYNIAKVAKGEILRYFNEVFDAMSKLAADPELSVKNGAELLDRLIKDIVAEQSTTYVSILVSSGGMGDDTDINSTAPISTPRNTAFSLPRFIPLLSERIHVKNPFTRNFLVSWITVLDSIPDLELVSFLPDFLDGLLNFLSDQNKDVRYATLTVLANFLAEIREAVEVREQQKTQAMKSYYVEQQRKTATASETASDAGESVKDGDILEEGLLIKASVDGNEINWDAVSINESEGKGRGSWVPGQGVVINYTRIVQILMPHLSSQALRWINEFILLAKEVIVPFTPQLIAAILPSLAHSILHILFALNIKILRLNSAVEANLNLYKLIFDTPTTPPPAYSGIKEVSSAPTPSMFSAVSLAASAMILASPPNNELTSQYSPQLGIIKENNTGLLSDPFDYQLTVEALMHQLMNDHEETRVASLEWLLMLHKKAPKKILAIDDGTFPALLKTLSDSSEEVVKRDLQLLAQISSNSEDEYFTRFMVDLLKLFSTDRRLLESREFASTMVQNLNIILITSPELSGLRKRLKSLETKDGQTLFTVLYKSWSHNPVSTFSLCLLAQAYEQAANLLQSFAELDITVNLLIQIDKLVQLLESPVFTYLRLQLLEPEKHPHLFKCLYGVLMLLPQSSAFATLRNRLNSVSSMGFLHLIPKTNPPPDTKSRSSKTAAVVKEDGIKWQELLIHFRAVQAKHEKSRKQCDYFY
ncbi:429_t:CDS:10 [Ambispora gerdemannii]|uniref:429_t:CDS:1 n=1 Tax=Ambispora gerdemannii TaxID=144530 RepID=A0A9N8ZTI5_9GLOM|nr:429_t:CDS:10 [Ambispora gerdemannii]